MHTDNFGEALDLILKKDRRYHRDAYLFVREALDHTQKIVGRASREGARQAIRHVSGEELLDGIRTYALEQFGPMALTVFNEWGVRCCEDFGEIVFNMVENNLLTKTKQDSRDSFKSRYDFDEVFRQPFLPAAKKALSQAQPTT